MSLSGKGSLIAFIGLCVLWPAVASAQAPPTSAKPAASARADLPPEHPPLARQQDIYQARPDSVAPDGNLPSGVIEVVVLDADQRPVSEAPLVLEVKRSTVSEGESRSRIAGTTDKSGRHRFTGLSGGNTISYRVIASRGPARFPSKQLGLYDTRGVRVVVHVYDPVTRIEDTRIGIHTSVSLDVKQSTISVSQTLQLFNIGRTALVPAGIRLSLPQDYQAFSSDGGLTEIDGVGAELEGTFPPGRSDISFRFQVPLRGETQMLALSLPPRVGSAQVMIAAGRRMSMKVTGFPPAQRTRLQDGRNALITKAQASSFSHSLTSLSITLGGLPEPHPATTIALLLAIALIGGGVWQLGKRLRGRHAAHRYERADLQEAQEILLGEVATLERSRQAGEITSKDHDQQRSELLDALTRILVKLAASPTEGAKEA